jgi:hypothetical protein
MEDGAPPVAPPPTAVATLASVPPTTTVLDPDLPPPEVPETEAPEGGRAIVDALGEQTPEKTKLQKAQEVAERVKARARQRRSDREGRMVAEQRAMQLEQQVASERARADRNDGIVQELETDFLGAARKRGIPQKAISQAAIEDTSPEGRIARLEAELRTERQARSQWQEEQRAAQEQSQVMAARQAAYREMTTEADGGDPIYPHLAAHARVRPDALLREAEHVVQQALARGYRGKDGRGLTNAEVLEYLEFQYAQAAGKAGPSKGNGGPAKPGGGGNGAAPSGANGGGPGGPGAKTLTSRSNEKAALPASFDDLDPDQQLAVMARQLRAAQAR